VVSDAWTTLWPLADKMDKARMAFLIDFNAWNGWGTQRVFIRAARRKGPHHLRVHTVRVPHPVARASRMSDQAQSTIEDRRERRSIIRLGLRIVVHGWRKLESLEVGVRRRPVPGLRIGMRTLILDRRGDVDGVWHGGLHHC
jgi:hypothetical protein